MQITFHSILNTSLLVQYSVIDYKIENSACHTKWRPFFFKAIFKNFSLIYVNFFFSSMKRGKTIFRKMASAGVAPLQTWRRSSTAPFLFINPRRHRMKDKHSRPLPKTRKNQTCSSPTMHIIFVAEKEKEDHFSVLMRVCVWVLASFQVSM